MYYDGTYMIEAANGKYVAPKHIFTRQFYETACGYISGSVKFAMVNKANGAPYDLIIANIDIVPNNYVESNKWAKLYIERMVQNAIRIIYQTSMPNLDRNLELYYNVVQRNVDNHCLDKAKAYFGTEWNNVTYDENEEYGD